MTRTTSHTCVFFDEGEPEHVCVCGARALVVTDADPAGPVLVLAGEPVARELAATA